MKILRFLGRYILGTVAIGTVFSFGAIGLSGVGVIGAPLGVSPPTEFSIVAFIAALKCYAFVAVFLFPVMVVAYFRNTD